MKHSCATMEVQNFDKVPNGVQNLQLEIMLLMYKNKLSDYVSLLLPSEHLRHKDLLLPTMTYYAFQKLNFSVIGKGYLHAIYDLFSMEI